METLKTIWNFPLFSISDSAPVLIGQLVLVLLVMGFGFTGYLLPWDQKAFWATTVGTRIAEVAPVIGNWILRIMRGGEELSALTLSRFHGTHVWVLPALLIMLLGVHLYLVIRIGISSVPEPEE